MTSMNIPLFPLYTVLFPGGLLPLKIFEPRYLSMVSDCMKNDKGFGVCLIKEGKESGDAAIPYPMGTLAKIVDWDQNESGQLTLVVEGVQRFRIERSAVRDDQLLIGDVTLLDNEKFHDLPNSYAPMAEALEQILNQLGRPFSTMNMHLGDAAWVSARLVELLPIPLLEKHSLLESSDPISRLEFLAARTDLGMLE